MKNSNNRKFTTLKKSMLLEEFNQFCKKITEEYANSEPQFARTYFCNRYEITIACFYKILEYATIENLVEDIIVQKMMRKAMLNQNAHKNGAGYSSIIKYARMYHKRWKNFAKKEMTAEEVKALAIDFGDNPKITKAEFASAYCVHSKVIDYALERAIEENIANDKTVDAIERRSIAHAKKDTIGSTKKYFSNLRERRRENQLRNCP